MQSVTSALSLTYRHLRRLRLAYPDCPATVAWYRATVAALAAIQGEDCTGGVDVTLN